MSISRAEATISCCRSADDGVGLNGKTDPRSTGMGQRIVTAMATKLEATVERDPNHAGTRIVLRFARLRSRRQGRQRRREVAVRAALRSAIALLLSSRA